MSRTTGTVPGRGATHSAAATNDRRARIAQIVAQAPPLTPGQADIIRTLLRGDLR